MSSAVSPDVLVLLWAVGGAALLTGAGQPRN